jgi:hypothetical protein
MRARLFANAGSGYRTAAYSQGGDRMDIDKSDLNLVRVLGGNMQVATMRMFGLIGVIALIVATLIWLLA